MLRTFKNTVCSAYPTYELPQEEAARGRRDAAAAKTVPNSEPASSRATQQKAKRMSTGRRERKFNLNTYKIHSLGDYAKAIRFFGTTDNYNSQTVNNLPKSFFFYFLICYIQGELEHRRGKRCYKRVSKGKFVVGIGKQIRRERLMHRIRERNKIRQQNQMIRNLPTVPFEEEETLPATSPNQHHHISVENRQKVQVVQWTSTNEKDPAVKVSCTYIILLQFSFCSRISYHASKTIFSHVLRTESTMATS